MDTGTPLLPEIHREPNWARSSFCAGASGVLARLFAGNKRGQCRETLAPRPAGLRGRSPDRIV